MNQITIRTILLCCFAVVSTFAWREYPYSNYKDKGCAKNDYVKVGCVNTKRHLIRGELLVYWRDDIEWAPNRLSTFASSFICACAEAATKANVPYFGTHFWGECWALTQAQIVNAPDGDCVAADGTYKTPCDKPGDSAHECLAVKSYYMYAVAEVSGGVPVIAPSIPPPPPVPQTCKALDLMRVGGNSVRGRRIRRRSNIKTINKLPGNYRIKFGFKIRSWPARKKTAFIFTARKKGGGNNVNSIPTVYMKNRKINIAFYNAAGKRVIAQVRKVPIRRRRWYRVVIRKNKTTLQVRVKLLHTKKKWKFNLRNQPAVSYRKLVLQPKGTFRLNGWIRNIQISGSCPKQ